MNKYLAGLITATCASVIGFVIHVGTQQWVRSWVTNHMEGRVVTPSWEVRYAEMSVGLVVLYGMVRPFLPGRSSVVRGLLLGVVLLAVMGRLFRQAVMNLVVGNPISVAVVQDGVSWVVWSCMCAVVALIYDHLAPRKAL